MKLQAVHIENYGIRKELADRGARIDALAVDRSRFLNAPMPRWSEEVGSLSQRSHLDGTR